jgi:RNA polymerase sigma-70 factor (ECF subfamily)
MRRLGALALNPTVSLTGLIGEPTEERAVPKTVLPPVVDLNEAWVIQRVKRGDVEAFGTLYRAYLRKVYAICYRITANESLAEELTQDVFLRVWERIGQYEGRSKFSTWLHRIATNRALDGLRAEIRRSARETSTEDPAAWEPPRPSPKPEGGLDLESAIASLPTSARTVFVLHDVEGYRHEEIAEMTGIAPGTSKSQLHRARRLLRTRLGS